MKRLMLFIMSCIFLSGCVVSPYSKYSAHNLDDGPNFLGGGYRTTKIAPGVYRIYAITNEAKLLNRDAKAEARQMWRDQALKVCGYDYIEKDVKEYEVVRDNLIIQDSDDYQNVIDGTVHCIGSSQITIEDNPTPPTSADLRSLLSENTMSGKTKKGNKFHVYYAPDGTMTGRVTNKTNTEYKDSGVWEVTDEGQYCETWKKWLDHKRNCYLLNSLGIGEYELEAVGKSDRYLVSMREGDPENLYPENLRASSTSVISMGMNLSGSYRLESSGETVTLVHKGDEITGSFGDSGEIWGEIEGDKIRFDFYSNGGGTGVGEWTIGGDGRRLEGNLINSTTRNQEVGNWDLIRVD